MELKDYYQVLGCDSSASAEEIKKAYREIAGKLHPDLASPRLKNWAEQQMKLVNEAYGVLGNSRKRADYDHLRQNGAFRAPRGYHRAAPGAPTILAVPLVRTIVITLAFMVGSAMVFSLLRFFFWNPKGVTMALAIIGVWIAVAWLRRRNRSRL